MLSLIGSLGTVIVKGAIGYVKRKQATKRAVERNKYRLASSQQSHNHAWEMAQLANSGWKDDVLFYAIILMYVYSAFDPEGAKKVFATWENLPEWWLQITGWLVASVLGVKKIGDYLPGAIAGVKQAIRTPPVVPMVKNAGAKMLDLLQEDKDFEGIPEKHLEDSDE